mgnify:CR=1 FL=1
MERRKIYPKYVGLFIKQETFDTLVKIADARGLYKGDEDITGNKLKQPKRGVSTLIRDIVEKHIIALDKTKSA